MAARDNPFESIERFFQRMSHEFDEAAQAWGEREGFKSWGDSLAMDLADHDTEFVVTVDIPGFDREEIDVDVTDRTLRVKAAHESESETEEDRYIQRERQHRTAERSIRLPEPVNAENVTAELKNGILTVTLPKVEPVRTHKHIDIE